MMDERAMEENVTESTEAKTASKEASTQHSGRKEELEAALEAASGYEDIPSVKEEQVRERELEEEIPNPWVEEEKEDEDSGLKATVVGVSANGKKMVAKPDPVYAGYTLCWADGGVMPKELDGRWTNIEKAKTAALVYLNSK